MKGQIFPDVMLKVVTLTRSGLTSAGISGVTVGTRLPVKGQAAARPYVMVRNDGAGLEAGGVVENSTVRIAIWHTSEAAGLALAQVVRSFLLDARSAGVHSVVPLSGPFTTDDPDTGSPLCYFTLAVRTRPA